MRVLTPVPLTPEAFSPFGDVVSADVGAARAANQGSATRADFTCALANGRPQARGNVAFVRSLPRPMPFEVKLIERHPHSSQLFAPMAVKRYVVICAPTLPNGDPDETQLAAFMAGPAQAINYRIGTWHHPLLVLDEAAQFLMLAWEDGSPGDCELRPLTQPWSLNA